VSEKKMMNAMYYKQIGDEILEVFPENDPESPREWDNLGKIEMYHRQYAFPHEGGFKDDQEGLEALLKSDDIAVVLPIYMYEHSGITIRTFSFNDRWDSGQVGYIYATKEDVREAFNVKRISKKTLSRVEKNLISEIETYYKYLRGDIVGFTLSKISVCDHGDEHKDEIDSCWGFYDRDDIMDQVDEKWKTVEWEDS
jgi:hypothetical protein